MDLNARMSQVQVEKIQGFWQGLHPVLFQQRGNTCWPQSPATIGVKGSRVPGQSVKASNVAIPGSEAQRKPEAGKAGVQAQRCTQVEDIYARGKSPFGELDEG